MCNCVNNKKQLSISLRKAKALETKNKKPYGVYAITNAETKKENIFINPVDAIIKNGKVCCYYNSEGKKVTVKKETKKPSTKKDDKKV